MAETSESKTKKDAINDEQQCHDPAVQGSKGANMNDLAVILKQTFKDKDYRHGYVDDFLNAYIATQIKVLREQRGWSQKELADHAGMMQPRISVLENVNYSSWSIKILRKIAEAFDLTLCVSFENFGSRLEDIEKFSRNNLERCSFDKDVKAR